MNTSNLATLTLLPSLSQFRGWHIRDDLPCGLLAPRSHLLKLLLSMKNLWVADKGKVAILKENHRNFYFYH